ncbi:MAG TPA: glycoside hydrolase family 3 N-terminal domain-containing protein [Prolixibacteraceae bacterium]
MQRLLIIIILSFLSSILFAQTKVRPPFLHYESDQWVDSVFNSLTIDEKIGQLIMVPAYSSKGSAHILKLERMVSENKIGGIISMQGGPIRHANMVNQLQKVSKTPLLVAIDAEYGLSMRLDSCIKYPYGFTIGAIHDDSLVYNLGADLGRQCKRLGISINFAPVADVNSNQLNPVIGFRSYGDNPKLVFQKAAAFGLGLQSQQVLATFKHFPGHGDTQKDSHYALPVIPHNRAQLDSIELVPFRNAVRYGIGSIMTGHLSVPALDSSGVAATFSKPMIQDLLIGEYGFEGLLVTDAMNMEGADDLEDSDGAEVKALLAGNDLLEFVVNPAKVIEAIKKAITDGKITEEAINSKCRKILMVKRWAGLNKNVPIKTESLYTDLNQSAYRMTLRNIAQQSLTVLKNTNEILPLRRLDTLKIATLSIGRGNITDFQKSIGKYTQADHFFISKDANDLTIKQLMVHLKKYNLVIAAINNLGNFVSSKYRITDTQQKVVQQVDANCKSIFVFLGNPYVLNYFEDVQKSSCLIVAYQESPESQDMAAQLIFGAFGARGKLPVNVSGNYHSGDGLVTSPIGRFKYTLPEEVGVDSTFLKKKIDSLVNIGLKEKAFPGCSIFLAKNGKVFFQESYGFHTYTGEQPLLQDDIFDFASLTKIMAPVPALMRLTDEKKIAVNQKMSDYWTDWKGSNKQGLILADVLSHQARLKTGIPFWMQTMDANGNYKSGFYSKDSTEKYSLRVSKDLYILNSFRDSVYAAIKKSTLLKRKRYVYSDIGFIIFPRIIESLSHEDYELYLKDNFYRPLGAYSLTYRPYLYQPIEKIDPTEFDDSFRKEQLQGFVHDESAAVLGGISGNAGLFGTINDAAKMMQMYLNYGFYGGDRYISESTMKDWTRRHFEKLDNRRGYGFDKPYPKNNLRKIGAAYPAPMSSDASFGHSGFTGTFAWADPVTGILFLFFSNRIYPTRSNNMINHLKLRELIQETAYEILLKKDGEKGK